MGNCVTQLKLLTLDKLSSTIFCCLSVSRMSGIGNTRPNLHFFQYIQAQKPFTDSVPTYRVTHSILGLVHKWPHHLGLSIPSFFICQFCDNQPTQPYTDFLHLRICLLWFFASRKILPLEFLTSGKCCLVGIFFEIFALLEFWPTRNCSPAR